MKLPEGILENTEAALALFSAVLSAGGLLLCLAAYAAIFLTLQSAEKALMPQFDSAALVLTDAQSTVSSAAGAVGDAGLAVGNVSSALGAYAEATDSLSDSLGAIAAIPPFSLEPKIAASAAKMRQGAGFFASASAGLNLSYSQAGESAVAVRKMADDLGSAGEALQAAKSSVKSAFGMMHIAALLAALCLCALFSSVVFLSVSVLLRHYPRLFDKEKKQ